MLIFSPMKRSFSIGLVALIAFTTGCSDVTFKEPLPLKRTSLNAFPNNWHGDWTDAEGDVYTITGEGFTSSDSATDPIQLGPTVLLKRFQGYLVLNQQQDNERWEVLLAKRKKDRVLLYQFEASNEASVAVWEAILGASMKEVAAATIDVNHKTYILSPENNLAFRQLILKGGLTEIGALTRIVD
tara:strand:+ start:3921 stop:4475 length:555 start_codon:yes stop_codon:yes gene_type:complete